jgi:hypothetical protein
LLLLDSFVDGFSALIGLHDTTASMLAFFAFGPLSG